MIPFWLEAGFYRTYIFLLKIGTMLLPFRDPHLFQGQGATTRLCQSAADDGVQKLLLVTDAQLVKIGLVAEIEQQLKAAGVEAVVYDGVLPDPTIAQIEAGLDQYQQHQCQAVLAVGGGSSIDAAKVIAARAKNKKPIRKMAGLFRITWGMAPMYAVPTTAGTGAEVTAAAVVSDPEAVKKFALVDPRLIPHKAALDGALMTGLPAHITAATGMDALTHAIEAYISNNAYWMTNKTAIAATQLIFQYLPRAVANGDDLEARHKMAEAAHLAGIAFTKAGVGYVHAISHNLAAHYHTPHGLTNAIVLPHVLDYSKPKCWQRLAALAKHCNMQRDGETDYELAERFIARIRQMNAEFGIPDHYQQLQAEHIPAIANGALKEARFTYAVPRYLDQQRCEQLIQQLAPAA